MVFSTFQGPPIEGMCRAFPGWKVRLLGMKGGRKRLGIGRKWTSFGGKLIGTDEFVYLLCERYKNSAISSVLF